MAPVLDPREHALRSLLQMQARSALSGVTALTDSSGGTASPGRVIQAFVTSFVNVANSGGQLAGKATTDSALASIQTAFATSFARLNTFQTALGLPVTTYNGGGTSGGNTLAAVTTSVTGATTGAPAADLAPIFRAFDVALDTLATETNKVLVATNRPLLVLPNDLTVVSTVPAFVVTTGTAVDPAVTKAVVDAELAKAANNFATIAAALNSARSGLGNLLVVAQ